MVAQEEGCVSFSGPLGVLPQVLKMGVTTADQSNSSVWVDSKVGTSGAVSVNGRGGAGTPQQEVQGCTESHASTGSLLHYPGITGARHGDYSNAVIGHDGCVLSNRPTGTHKCLQTCTCSVTRSET